MWPRYEDKLARLDPSPFVNTILHDAKVIFKWLLGRIVWFGSLLALLWWANLWPWALGFALLLVGLGRWLYWLLHKKRFARGHHAIPLVGALSLGMLWSATLLWLVMWRVEAPQRAQFDARWNQLMSQGEMNLIRQQGRF